MENFVRNSQKMYGAVWLIAIFFIIISPSFAENSGFGTAFEGGRGLLYMQSAHTYGKGNYAVGFQGLIMKRKYKTNYTTSVVVRENNPIIVGVPITYGLTDIIDFTGGFYFFHDARPFRDMSNISNYYDLAESGIGSIRLGLKARLPFNKKTRIQIAGKLSAMVNTSSSQFDGMNYRWIRSETDIEASLLETINLTQFHSMHFEQGFVRSGSDIFDDQIVLAAGICIQPVSRLFLNMEVNNRTFNGVSPQALLKGLKYPSLYGPDIAHRYDPEYLQDDELNFNEDFFAVVPTVSYQIKENTTINAGAVINIASHAFSPQETVQFALGITFHSPMYVDFDNDGVRDKTDLEHNTPKGYPVDNKGVSLDSDTDGIPDGRDREIHTPKGAIVNNQGVGKDSDGDGVYDGIDREPNTTKGCNVDQYGVALDGDSDGVPDCLDRELNTPVGSEVDEHGVAKKIASAPPVVKVEDVKQIEDVKQRESKLNKILLQKKSLRLYRIYFAQGSSQISPESHYALRQVNKLLLKYPEMHIHIEGHSDYPGSSDENKKLSLKRARVVLDYILKLQPELDSSRFRIVGYGNDKPLSPNLVGDARKYNRRVEFTIIDR